jgi:small subunit ribosomal protein S20
MQRSLETGPKGDFESPGKRGIANSQQPKANSQFSLLVCILKYSPYLCTPYFGEEDMANHKSAEKRIRSSETKRVRNRYQHKTARTVIKKLKTTTVKSEATELFRQVSAMIDKLAKNNIIHWKKAANQKSKLAKFVNGLEK